jgi:ankyrin repeat protein
MDDKPQFWSPKAGEKGMTQLHYGAYCQDFAAVKYWVEQGYDVNQKTDAGWTPLVWCIDMAGTGPKGAAEAIVSYLIEHGSELEYKDKYCASLLEFAEDARPFIADHLRKILNDKRVA